ncbi:hypothetical protein ALC53_06225 [Atta colombica]|uniref:DNA-directed DNA polymerase n=1 Tax=Atta colombica TaxID=520822 RepID=A0A151I3A7_9HYME|nr:hypothetical protein ALC53_06225 [Atta colombica]
MAQFKSKRSRRYDLKFKKFALCLYFLSPRTYRELQKSIALPSVHSLNLFIKRWNIVSSINNKIFEAMKLKLNSLSLTETLCILCVNEMNLKIHLFYNISSDKIIRFENTDDKKSSVPAKNALVIMAHSIAGEWKLSVCFCLVKTMCRSNILKNLLYDIIIKLQNNSSSLNNCKEYEKAFTGNDKQMQFLEEMLYFIKSIKVVNQNNSIIQLNNIKILNVTREYRVMEKWECEFTREKRENREMRNFLENHPMLEHEITNILPVNDEIICCDYAKRRSRLLCNPVIVVTWTTSQAQLILYEYLEKLGSRVLYCDTDPCIYVSRGEPSEPCMGNFLGDITDELESYGWGSFIESFMSGGPKFYVYVVRTPKDNRHEICKIKGITLNYKNFRIINFNSIRKLIMKKKAR